MVRKQPNVYAEISAIYYRPWQFWNIMIRAQEYLITDKIFFGTDFPFSTVEDRWPASARSTTWSWAPACRGSAPR